MQLKTQHDRVCDVSPLNNSHQVTSFLFIYLFLEPNKIPTYAHIFANAVVKVFLPIYVHAYNTQI